MSDKVWTYGGRELLLVRVLRKHWNKCHLHPDQEVSLSLGQMCILFLIFLLC